MARLRIDLQDGFTGERVIVRVNDIEVFDDSATSSLMTGVAGTIEVDVPDGQASINTDVPSRGISALLPIHTSQTLNVGVAIRDGAIIYRPSDQPFAYI